MQFNVYYTDAKGNPGETKTDAPGSRDAKTKVAKRLPGVTIVKVEKASRKAN